MARLGINIEEIAALRDLRYAKTPDPVTAAVFIEVGGADGIVCPLNDAMRPIQERDLRLLREAVKTHFNLQLPPTGKLMTLAFNVAPDMITLVGGKKDSSSSAGGLDVMAQTEELSRIVKEIRAQDIVVAVQIEPSIHQVKAAAKVGADYVEFHLGKLSNAKDLNDRTDILDTLRSVVLAAAKMDLGVAAGQGVTYQNAGEIAAMEKMEELNVGHAVISRALWVGMEQAVRDMAALMQ